MSVSWLFNKYKSSSVRIENTVVIIENTAICGVLYVIGKHTGKIYYAKSINNAAGKTPVDVVFNGNIVDNEYIAKFEYGSKVEESQPFSVEFNISSSYLLKNIMVSLGEFLKNGLSREVDVYPDKVPDEVLRDLQKPAVTFYISRIDFNDNPQPADTFSVEIVEVSIVGVSLKYSETYDIYDILIELVKKYPVHVNGLGDLKMNHKTIDFGTAVEGDKEVYFFNAFFDFEVL